MADIGLLPSNNNTYLAADPNSLYTPTLFLISTALFQHAFIFGLIFLVRGFSVPRIFDLHYLALLLAVTLSLAPLVFIIDTDLDAKKLFFFLEHESLEFIIAVRVLAPVLVARNAGTVLLIGWSCLSFISILVSLDPFYGHAADIVAWGAFTSDFSLGIAGVVLLRRWFSVRPKLPLMTPLMRRKIRAETLAGLGFTFHGFSTMTIAPIFTRVLYHNLDPKWFAYGWAVVFGAGLWTVALCVPCAGLVFDGVRWCCWIERGAGVGEVGWVEDTEEDVGAVINDDFGSQVNLVGNVDGNGGGIRL